MSQELISDTTASFVGGQDASKTPHLVPENAYFAGVNVSVERGNVKPRWGMFKHSQSLPSGSVIQRTIPVKSYADIFKNGKFQCVADYSIGSDFYLVFVISGQIFFLNIATFEVEQIPLEGEGINPLAPRLDWSPAGPYLIITDFPNYPIIIDGGTARRANPEDFEIPVCNVIGYNQNRLIIGNAGNEFTAGDPAGSLATPNAPLTFLEVLLPNTGFTDQVFAIGTNYNNDPITSISFLQVSDTSTGIGPLLVSTRKAIYSYQTQLPRTSWENGTFGTNLVYNAGIVGPRAVDHLNSDMIFVSQDGMVRSIAMSRDEQSKWSKTPMSREVQNWLSVVDPSLLQYTFVTYFNNKVFIGANPYRTTALGINNEPLPDYAHGGMVVLELDNISTLTKETPPVWSGLWTGVRPMDMVVCNDRAFIISKDGGTNEIYEVRPDLTYDTDGKNVRYINSKIYTREYDFQGSLFNNKQLHSVDLRLKDLRGDFKVAVSYKADHSSRFEFWREFKHAAPWRNCKVPFTMPGLAPHNFLEINLGSPKDAECSEPSKTFGTTFRAVQLLIELEGVYWELESLQLNAQFDRQSKNITICKKYPASKLPLQCTNNWGYGEFQSCQQKQT